MGGDNQMCRSMAEGFTKMLQSGNRYIYIYAIFDYAWEKEAYWSERKKTTKTELHHLEHIYLYSDNLISVKASAHLSLQN